MPEQSILVIDDEVFVRELLEEYFGRLDYTVRTAESGDAGIEAVRDTCFSVALVDLKMPGRDGIETLREIRKIDPLCLTIIMTGYPTIDSSIEALRAGAYDYVIKPFKLSELREVVDRATGEYQLKAEVDRIQRNIESVEGELRDYRDTRAKPPKKQKKRTKTDYIESQLRELDDLHDAGMLNTGEYEMRKRDLLSRDREGAG